MCLFPVVVRGRQRQMIEIGQVVLKGPKFIFYKTVLNIFLLHQNYVFKNRTKQLMKVISAIGCFPERRIKSTRTA